MRPRHYGLPYLLAASVSLGLLGCSSSPKPNLTMLADSTKIASNTPEPVAPPPAEGIDTEFCFETADCGTGAASIVVHATKGEKAIDVPDAGQDATLLSLAAFLDNIRQRKTPVNNPASARLSTLTAMLGRKSIYEKRVVAWEEIEAEASAGTT